MISTITATAYDATYGAVTVTKRSSRPFTHAVIRVADAGDVSASFHMTQAAAERAGGKPAPGITRHVVSVTGADDYERPQRFPTVVVRSSQSEVDAINASIRVSDTITELPAGNGLGDAMRSELNRGLMVSWINADLANRADCDIRRSIVLWDQDRVFVMALGTGVTPDIFRDRVSLVSDSMARMGIRYWSVGIAS